MGNTGSAHNLHNEGIDSELNPYYAQQYLRRNLGERKKKYNQILLGGWSSGRNASECKVLPKTAEKLKLRATTNGAILQAGGTIRFRAKEQMDEKPSGAFLNRKNEDNIAYPMRRCHTIILDGQTDPASHRKSAPPLTEFRRSQTLLHVGYSRTKSQENISQNIEEEKTHSVQQSTNTTTTMTKVNKYNKKRKAPPAPAKTGISADNTNTGQILPVISNDTPAGKPRIYTTNGNKSTLVQQQQQQQQHLLQIRPRQSQSSSTTAFQRGSNVHSSTNSSKSVHNSNNSYASKLPYRREKSFDAVLLSHKEINDCDNERSSIRKANMITSRELVVPQLVKNIDNTKQRMAVGGGKQKLTRTYANNITNKISNASDSTYHLETNYQIPIRKVVEKTVDPISSSDFRVGSSEQNSGTANNVLKVNGKTKFQQSRIPQLKRTFYFGMELSDKTSDNTKTQSNIPKDSCMSEYKNCDKDDNVLLNHTIDADEEIIDNGILVHVRPTLPRRQLETPNFSPTAAWRNLLEEQEWLKHERSSSKPKVLSSPVMELPICLSTSAKENSKLAANWIPQQDLEDDDDEDNENDHKSKAIKSSHEMDHQVQKLNTNSLHIFSLSLPRDVHLQCQMRNSVYCTEQETPNCWLVPGFSSLQKLRTHLAKKTDSHHEHKCTCTVKTTSKCSSNRLSTIYGETYSSNLTSHQPDCEFYKSLPLQSSYRNDNWVLHKSEPFSTDFATSDKTLQKYSLNTNSSVHLQPKSLTNICGGKHIVYLPGQESFNILNKNNISNHEKQTNGTKSNYKRQRQRQESLQDTMPIQNVHQSNACTSEKNTHRFSFQSTVRVLEKRRLAEKLSKDAEIQEAQRLHELEAMKRVEEDFQRKRAPEKANLRNQLRLHLKSNIDNEEYRSLPLNINGHYESHHTQNQQISDVNNNIFCRAEPDGAVSPSADFNDHDKLRQPNYSKLRRFEFHGEESESETQMTELQCTSILIEPYLHSIY